MAIKCLRDCFSERKTEGRKQRGAKENLLFFGAEGTWIKESGFGGWRVGVRGHLFTYNDFLKEM